MEFIPEAINRYSECHSQPESPVLKELNRETQAKTLSPRMLSGHLQGRILSMISKMIMPKRILEIGTFTGYSAICLSEGLAKNGQLISIDVNEEMETRIIDFWKKAGITDQASLLIGNALEVIPEIHDKFDLVFIDADKENYTHYYDLVVPKMNSGGIILADNVLWSGKVTNNPENYDYDTKVMDNFNKKVLEDSRVENLLLPVRDGIMIIRKL